MEYVLQRGSALLWARRLKRVDEAGLRRAERQERAEGSVKGRVKAAEVQSGLCPCHNCCFLCGPSLLFLHINWTLHPF